MRSSTCPISRRTAESLRLAVSRTLPRLSRQPSIAETSPENSPTLCRSPRAWGTRRRSGRASDRGCRWPGGSRPSRPAPRPRAPRRPGPAGPAGGCRAGRRTGASAPAQSASAISVVSDWRSRISPGSTLGSECQCLRLAQRAGRPCGDQRADLVELQEFQRVTIHDDSRPDAAPRAWGEPLRPHGRAPDRHEWPWPGSRPYPSIIARDVPDRRWHFHDVARGRHASGSAESRRHRPSRQRRSVDGAGSVDPGVGGFSALASWGSRSRRQSLG